MYCTTLSDELAGPPSRHHERLGEELERADHLENEEEEGRRADQRQRDVAEALPRVGAVGVCGVVQFLAAPLAARPDRRPS
jgi:hypothetical protein